MNEFKSASQQSQTRRHLFSTVCVLALVSSVRFGAIAATDDQPTVWLELGGQLDHVMGQGSRFPVGFISANSTSPVLSPVSPLQAQTPEPFDFVETGKLSLRPHGSDWSFSASVAYGRSRNFKHVDHQIYGKFYEAYVDGVRATNVNPVGADDFADTQVHRQTSRTVLDFSVGKDVGLGMFGREGAFTINGGVRFAQFSSNTTFDVRARPDLQFKYTHFASRTLKLPHFHTYHGSGSASRSFLGIGPSLSLNASTPFAGDESTGEVVLDWGANAGILFGRQRASVQHHESAHYLPPNCAFLSCHYSSKQVYERSGGHSRNAALVAPNLGGFAGISYRIENFKVSAGYRADFFFGAIDGGIDTRKSENVGFYGPFATISIGLGG